MDTVQAIFLVLHLLGWAMVFGGALAGMKGVTLTPGTFHGVLTALVTGIVLTGLLGADANHMKIGIKLVVALAVTAMIVVGRRRPELVTRGFLGGIAGLTALNVAIAVLWR